MHSQPGSSASPKLSALNSFLHGVEPRAWVFALSQCGDEAAADTALDLAVHNFAEQSRAAPLSEWPMLFWTSLLGQSPMQASFDSPSILALMDPGARAALLLRLIVGLDFEPAAKVLQVSPSAYEKALRSALAQPGMDDSKMQALREDLHEQVQGLSAERRQILQRLRESALASIRTEVAVKAPIRKPRFGRKRWWLAAAMALAGIVLVVGLYKPVRSLIAPGQTEPLPIEEVAPPPSLSDTVVVTHPDYEQIAEPASESIALQTGFLSWLAATILPKEENGIAEAEATAADSFDGLSAEEQSLLASAQSAWPTLQPSARLALVRSAEDWRSRTPESRKQLRQRLRSWDQQAAPERARRRAPFVAWQQLDLADQKRIRAAAAYVLALPQVDQESLKAEFAAQPDDARTIWWMGPSLGQELLPLASLFAFMPEADRTALLTAVHELDPQSRDDLATLAPRLSEAQRQSLRNELLAIPPGQRAQMIRQRLE